MKNILTAILFVLILGLAIYTLELNNEIQIIRDNENKLVEQNKMLNSKVNILSYQVSELNESLISLNQQLNETVLTQKQEINNLISNLDEYDSELKSRLKWIASNSEINESPYYVSYPFYKCVSNSEINLGCIGYILFDEMKLHYISDPNKTDELFSINQIYHRGGGDCEDLSLAFSSSIRYLMKEYHTNKFVSWKDNGSDNFIIYKNGDTEYYFKNAQIIHFTANHVYVTCYSINATTGHCIVALCKNKVLNGDFSNCTMVEPQQYGMIKSPIHNLELYISSNNLCMPFNGTITCFTDFENQIEEILNKYST